MSLVSARYGIRYVVLYGSMILAGLCINQSWAATSLQKKICGSLKHERSNRAFLFDEAGTRLLPYFDIGQMDATKGNWQRDYLMSPNQFRLVLFPKKLRFESLPGGVYFEERAVKPQCPGTAEYLLRVGVAPTHIGVGKLDGDYLAFKIIDTKSEFPENVIVKTSYQARLVAVLSRPQIDIDETTLSREGLHALFKPGGGLVQLMLTNTGDRSIRLGDWRSLGAEQDSEIAIRRNTCINVVVGPRENCVIAIEKTSHHALQKAFYGWYAEGTQGGFHVNLDLKMEKYNNDVGIGVRNH